MNLTPLEEAQCLYSDMYKDVHGYRPSGFSHLSLPELELSIAALEAEIADRILDEAEDAWKKYA